MITKHPYYLAHPVQFTEKEPGDLAKATKILGIARVNVVDRNCKSASEAVCRILPEEIF